MDREDHDLLIKINERLKNIERDIPNRCAEQEKDIDDIKTWKNTINGALKIIIILLTLLSGVISFIITKLFWK